MREHRPGKGIVPAQTALPSATEYGPYGRLADAIQNSLLSEHAVTAQLGGDRGRGKVRFVGLEGPDGDTRIHVHAWDNTVSVSQAKGVDVKWLNTRTGDYGFSRVFQSFRREPGDLSGRFHIHEGEPPDATHLWEKFGAGYDYLALRPETRTMNPDDLAIYIDSLEGARYSPAATAQTVQYLVEGGATIITSEAEQASKTERKELE